MKQPSFKTFLGKRSGLVGSQRQTGAKQTSETPVKGSGGRDLNTQQTNSTRGRFGEGKKGRKKVWELEPRPSPMDKFLRKEGTATTASGGASPTNLGKGQGRKDWTEKVEGRTYHSWKEGEQEEEKE